MMERGTVKIAFTQSGCAFQLLQHAAVVGLEGCLFMQACIVPGTCMYVQWEGISFWRAGKVVGM